jgi:hypothetical protein
VRPQLLLLLLNIHRLYRRVLPIRLVTTRCANASSWSPSSLFDYQSSFGLSQETDADDPAVYIDAVKKLDELPAYLKKLQRQVFEAETAKEAAELKLREYEERIRLCK